MAWLAHAARGALAPLLSLLAAAAASALLFLAIGVDPWTALSTIASGAFGSADGIGYTLFYTTDFILAGLAVAIPYKAGLFNIGGEGQASVGGLAVTLVCLAMGDAPRLLVVPTAIAAGALGGAVWALVPGLMLAGRRVNIVITTILFNFLASALLSGLLVDRLKAPGDASPETVPLAPSTFLPTLSDRTPLNISLVLAVALAVVAWVALKRSVWGYELRCVGESPEAARYAAVPVGRVLLGAICLGGACAGLIGVNQVMGAEHRLVLGFAGGSGFIGIAVALMARSHPLGLIASALLFGALYQGGAELSFDLPSVTRDVVVALNGVVILLCGALEAAWRRPAAALWRRLGGAWP